MMRDRGHRLRKLVLLIAIATLAFQPASPQVRDERAVRVAYLYNLIKFVDWPSASDDLLIGHIGSSAAGETLRKSLDGRKSDARTVHVVLSPSDELLEKCAIIYFGEASPEDIRKTLAKVEGHSVLTLGETESFPQRGGMIGLVKVEDHIEILVNLALTQRSGVKISSHVLNLAKIVRSGGER